MRSTIVIASFALTLLAAPVHIGQNQGDAQGVSIEHSVRSPSSINHREPVPRPFLKTFDPFTAENRKDRREAEAFVKDSSINRHAAQAKRGNTRANNRREAEAFVKDTGVDRREAEAFVKDTGVDRREAEAFVKDTGVDRREAEAFVKDTGVDRREAEAFVKDTGVDRREAEPVVQWDGANDSQRESSAENEYGRRDAEPENKSGVDNTGLTTLAYVPLSDRNHELKPVTSGYGPRSDYPTRPGQGGEPRIGHQPKRS